MHYCGLIDSGEFHRFHLATCFPDKDSASTLQSAHETSTLDGNNRSSQSINFHNNLSLMSMYISARCTCYNMP